MSWKDIIKDDSELTGSAKRLAEIVEEAGFPDNMIKGLTNSNVDEKIQYLYKETKRVINMVNSFGGRIHSSDEELRDKYMALANAVREFEVDMEIQQGEVEEERRADQQAGTRFER